MFNLGWETSPEMTLKLNYFSSLALKRKFNWDSEEKKYWGIFFKLNESQLAFKSVSN